MGRALRIGLYSPYFGSTYGGGEKYLGVAAEALRDAFPEHRVEIAGAAPIDRERYERVLGLDLEGIGLHSGSPRPGPLRRLARVRALRGLRDRLVGGQAARISARYDLFLAMVYRIPIDCRAARGVILCQFPYRSREALDGYAEVICQSEYVRHWVREWWGREAAVVNPPVDVPAAEPDWARKRPVILSVGRFVAGGHVKRHDVLVRAFADLAAAGLEGWELHLAGSLHADRASRAYFEHVRRLAQGLPVRLHPDLARTDLLELYDQASIYWHAAGYGAPEDDPEALEHFGMTTVEAMAHGAVPVVIARGGQVEVVEDGRDGRLWSDLEGLRRCTMELVSDEALRRRLASAARARSARYARPEFKRRLVAALAPQVAALAGAPA